MTVLCGVVLLHFPRQGAQDWLSLPSDGVSEIVWRWGRPGMLDRWEMEAVFSQGAGSSWNKAGLGKWSSAQTDPGWGERT